MDRHFVWGEGGQDYSRLQSLCVAVPISTPAGLFSYSRAGVHRSSRPRSFPEEKIQVCVVTWLSMFGCKPFGWKNWFCELQYSTLNQKQVPRLRIFWDTHREYPTILYTVQCTCIHGFKILGIQKPDLYSITIASTPALQPWQAWFLSRHSDYFLAECGALNHLVYSQICSGLEFDISSRSTEYQCTIFWGSTKGWGKKQIF